MDKKKQEEWEVLNEMVEDGVLIIEQGEEGPEIILTEKGHEEFKTSVAEFGHSDPVLQAMADRDFRSDGKGTSLRKALILGEVLTKPEDIDED